MTRRKIYQKEDQDGGFSPPILKGVSGEREKREVTCCHSIDVKWQVDVNQGSQRFFLFFFLLLLQIGTLAREPPSHYPSWSALLSRTFFCWLRVAETPNLETEERNQIE